MRSFVLESTLRARINRKLANRYQKLCLARGSTMEQRVGRYYLLDTHEDRIIGTRVDLEALGREMGVWGETERLL